MAITTTGRSVPAVIDRFADLAEAVGADLSAPDVVRAKIRFERAADQLRAVATAKGGLRVMVCWTPSEQLEVLNPRTYPFGLFLRSRGVDLIVPDIDASEAAESVSWELADKYPADLIVRFVNPQFPDAGAGAIDNPLWDRLPAVRAGQVTTWDPSWHLHSHANLSAILTRLANTVRRANPRVAG